ncbi:MAG: hypothetical protein ABIP79_06380 [Chitinophagaceae bacterium]
MLRSQKNSTISGALMALLVFINVIILKESIVTVKELYWLLWLTIPLLLITIFRFRRKTTQR